MLIGVDKEIDMTKVMYLKEIRSITGSSITINVKSGDILVGTRQGTGLIFIGDVYDNALTHLDISLTGMSVTGTSATTITLNRTAQYSGQIVHYSTK